MSRPGAYRAPRRIASRQEPGRSAARGDFADLVVPVEARTVAEDRLARPMVAVDTVLFAVHEGQLKTYLVQLNEGPLDGGWAFPGGLIRVNEMLDEAARRELSASTGLKDTYMEQLFTFGDPARDPRAHVVSVAYMALVPDPAVAQTPRSSKYRTGKWFETCALPTLAYDHSLMARLAVNRLRSKLEYTNIAYNLLPVVFTFAEFEKLYSSTLGRPIDRRNFRRRILSMGLLKQLASKRRGAHRPAALYRFARRSPQVAQML